jgi:hypothetical protein
VVELEQLAHANLIQVTKTVVLVEVVVMEEAEDLLNNQHNQEIQAHMDLEVPADKLDQMDQVKVALVVVALVAQVEILTII